MKNAYNLGVLRLVKAGYRETWASSRFARNLDMEPDAGLGNAGLGRLAACLPGQPDHPGDPRPGLLHLLWLGIFKQKIVDGQQIGGRTTGWTRG